MGLASQSPAHVVWVVLSFRSMSHTYHYACVSLIVKWARPNPIYHRATFWLTNLMHGTRYILQISWHGPDLLNCGLDSGLTTRPSLDKKSFRQGTPGPWTPFGLTTKLPLVKYLCSATYIVAGPLTLCHLKLFLLDGRNDLMLTYGLELSCVKNWLHSTQVSPFVLDASHE